MKSGMKFLIESFYRSIREGAPLPITPREILTTARVMEEIFQQLNERPARPGGLALPVPEGQGMARRAGMA
jgi:predicted dehydrogenase